MIIGHGIPVPQQRPLSPLVVLGSHGLPVGRARRYLVRAARDAVVREFGGCNGAGVADDVVAGKLGQGEVEKPGGWTEPAAGRSCPP